MFADINILFLQFKDGHEFRQINPSRTIMNLQYTITNLSPKMAFCVLRNLCFKTTCNIRPHFHGPNDGLKLEGALCNIQYSASSHDSQWLCDKHSYCEWSISVQ